MPRKIQSAYTVSPKNDICCIGDSLTHNYDLGVPATAWWHQLLAASLKGLNASVRMRDFGKQGDSSSNVVLRFPAMTMIKVPTIGIIFACVNDPGGNSTVQASPTPTSTVFAVAAGLGARHSAGGYCLVNGVSRQVKSVATDTITLATALAGAPTVGQSVAVDTSANLQAMIGSLVASGCKKIVVLNTQYLNYSGAFTDGSQRDTTTTPFTTYATLRTTQAAAITAAQAANPSASIVLADLYTWMRNLIVGGTDTQGSFSWHVADGNQHFNTYGMQVVRDCLLSTIQAQTGWIDALK